MFFAVIRCISSRCPSKLIRTSNSKVGSGLTKHSNLTVTYNIIVEIASGKRDAPHRANMLIVLSTCDSMALNFNFKDEHHLSYFVR